MKKIKFLFPIQLYLYIFQLEGYDIPRFIKWFSKNLFTRKIEEKRKLVYTFKTKLLLSITILLIVFSTIFIFGSSNNIFYTLLVLLILLLLPYIPLIISRIIIFPIEYIVSKMVAYKTHQKIKSIENLKVIAITGSYGKTSVKEILYQIIKNKYKTLRTPESYNTELGIAKVVDYELDDSYQYFICEMAAYHKNDIYNLCKIVPPNYGIITGITSQHLERFGSLKNIIKSKFELYDSILDKSNIILNIGNENIAKELARRNILDSNIYLKYSGVRFSKLGSTFILNVKDKKYKVETRLFGFSNIQNLVGAITMALKLNIEIEYIVERIKYITPVSNRFVTRQINNAIIVDNTFSSNEESFREMIQTAKNVIGSKVLVTPGLVELGKEEELINSNIGKLTEFVFDKTILVGSNKRTKSFSKFLNEKPEHILDTRKEYFDKITELSKKYDWIFLENDITENY